VLGSSEGAASIASLNSVSERGVGLQVRLRLMHRGGGLNARVVINCMLETKQAHGCCLHGVMAAACMFGSCYLHGQTGCCLHGAIICLSCC
jgi:hypothetical protein